MDTEINVRDHTDTERKPKSDKSSVTGSSNSAGYSWYWETPCYVSVAVDWRIFVDRVPKIYCNNKTHVYHDEWFDCYVGAHGCEAGTWTLFIHKNDLDVPRIDFSP